MNKKNLQKSKFEKYHLIETKVKKNEFIGIKNLKTLIYRGQEYIKPYLYT